MRRKDLFIEGIKTMLYSWGGDTPSEVFWALNDFIDFYQHETGRVLTLPEYNEDGSWGDSVIEALESDGLNETLESFNRLS